MFNAETIEIAIGLVFYYLLLSLLITTLNELISSVLSLRAKQLRKAVGKMLGETHKEAFYTHPLVGEAARKVRSWLPRMGGEIPSYLRSGTFAQVFMELVKREIAIGREIAKSMAPKNGHDGRSGQSSAQSFHDFDNMTLRQCNEFIAQQKEKKHQPEEIAFKADLPTLVQAVNFARAADVTIQNLVETVQAMNLPENTKAVIVALAREAEGDLAIFKQKLEDWFNAKMERVTGWYVRQMRYNTLGGAMVIAVAMNADTFFVVQKLAHDSSARKAMVDAATNYVAKVQPIFAAKDSAAETTDSPKTKPQDTDVQSPAHEGDKANPRVAASDTVPKDSAQLGHADSVPAGAAKPIAQNPALDEDSAMLANIDTLVKKTNALLTEDIAFANQTMGMGWSKMNSSVGPGTSGCWSIVLFWLKKACGWLLTALAISLGAPFWFDILKKLISIRGAGVNPDEAGKSKEKAVG